MFCESEHEKVCITFCYLKEECFEMILTSAISFKSNSATTEVLECVCACQHARPCVFYS